MNDILEQRKRVQANIMKGFGESSVQGEEIEKAKRVIRQDGDMHPNGKWVWNSSAAGGKGDWRVAKKKDDKQQDNTEANTRRQNVAGIMGMKEESIKDLIKDAKDKKTIKDLGIVADEIISRDKATITSILNTQSPSKEQLSRLTEKAKRVKSMIEGNDKTAQSTKTNEDGFENYTKRHLDDLVMRKKFDPKHLEDMNDAELKHIFYFAANNMNNPNVNQFGQEQAKDWMNGVLKEGVERKKREVQKSKNDKQPKKPFSQKTWKELREEFVNDFNSDADKFADNYGRTVDEMKKLLADKQEDEKLKEMASKPKKQPAKLTTSQKNLENITKNSDFIESRLEKLNLNDKDQKYLSKQLDKFRSLTEQLGGGSHVWRADSEEYKLVIERREIHHRLNDRISKIARSRGLPDLNLDNAAWQMYKDMLKNNGKIPNEREISSFYGEMGKLLNELGGGITHGDKYFTFEIDRAKNIYRANQDEK